MMSEAMPKESNSPLLIGVLLVIVVIVALPPLNGQTQASNVPDQTTYVTVYGQLSSNQCASTTYTNPLVGPCQNYFELITNGTTPNIPSYLVLDFSQVLSPYSSPSQSDVGKTIVVTGYYGQESACPIVNGCSAFFVQTWGPYWGTSSLPTATGCWVQSNSPTGAWQQVQCVTAPTIPLIATYTTYTSTNQYGQTITSVITYTSTIQTTCTTTWTHTGGYLPVPSGVCQEIVPCPSWGCGLPPSSFPSPPQSLTDVPRFLQQFWSWVRCRFFGHC